MARSKVFHVVDNRIQFRCTTCGTRRNLPVAPNARRRSVRCHKCGTHSECLLNRRSHQREQQSGKVTMVMRDGQEVEIYLHDISAKGAGFELVLGDSNLLSLRQEVYFRCTWNPKLLGEGRYVVQSINGQRVGVQSVLKSKP